MGAYNIKSHQAKALKKKSSNDQHKNSSPNSARLPLETASNEEMSEPRKDRDRLPPQEQVMTEFRLKRNMAVTEFFLSTSKLRRMTRNECRQTRTKESTKSHLIIGEQGLNKNRLLNCMKKLTPFTIPTNYTSATRVGTSYQLLLRSNSHVCVQ